MVNYQYGQANTHAVKLMRINKHAQFAAMRLVRGKQRRAPGVKRQAPKLIRLITMSIAVVLSGCGTTCSDEVLQSVISPSKKVESFHVRRNCGATTGYSHHIYIAPTGRSYEKSEPVLTADKVSLMEAKWEDAKTLRIIYGSARIFHFTNFWHSKDVDNFEHIIQVRLDDGT